MSSFIRLCICQVYAQPLVCPSSQDPQNTPQTHFTMRTLKPRKPYPETLGTSRPPCSLPGTGLTLAGQVMRCGEGSAKGDYLRYPCVHRRGFRGSGRTVVGGSQSDKLKPIPFPECSDELHGCSSITIIPPPQELHKERDSVASNGHPAPCYPQGGNWTCCLLSRWDFLPFPGSPPWV